MLRSAVIGRLFRRGLSGREHRGFPGRTQPSVCLFWRGAADYYAVGMLGGKFNRKNTKTITWAEEGSRSEVGSCRTMGSNTLPPSFTINTRFPGDFRTRENCAPARSI